MNHAAHRPSGCLIALPLLGLLLLAAGCANPSAEPSAELYNRVRLASVEVIVDGHLFGSGWFANSTGGIITAAHVVNSARDIEIVKADQTRERVRVVAMDRGNDLALLQTKEYKTAKEARRREGEPHWLEVADAPPPPGSTVFNFGAPLYRHAVMLRGAVARAEPVYEYLGDQKDYMRVYHFTAAAPPGTSGGCWIDPAGRVIGNQCGVMWYDGRWIGIAFVSSPDAILRLLRTCQSVPAASLNAAVEELAEHNAQTVAKYAPHREGLLLVNVHSGGAADIAGLKAQELIVEADGRPMRYRDELIGLIRAKQPGELVTLKVIAADGKTSHEATIKLHDFAQTTPTTRPSTRPATRPSTLRRLLGASRPAE